VEKPLAVGFVNNEGAAGCRKRNIREVNPGEEAGREKGRGGGCMRAVQ
jgi:hypothetical protein